VYQVSAYRYLKDTSKYSYLGYKHPGNSNRSQVVNLAWCCRHICIPDEYLVHTTGELPTEGV